MQKIYLLLRSNKQTGPYTLEELLQLNLKPFDLVWVDGRSAAWQYPFEIPALKPYVPETPQADVPFQPVATSAMEEKIVQSANSTVQKQEAPKRVFVSVPKPYAAVAQKTYADHSAFMPPVEKPSYEAKEEAISTTPSYTQPSVSSQKPVEEEVIHTGYSRSLNEVEEDYTNWMYRQKTKKKSSVNAKDLVLTALVLIVIGGGYYVMSRPSITNSVLPSAKIIKPSSVQPMENAVTEPGQNIETISNQNASVTPEQTLVSNPSNIQPDHTVKNIKTKNPVIVSKAQTNSSVPSSQNSMPVEKTTPNIQPANTDVVSKEPEVKQQPNVEKAPEKKKKIADVLKGIFSKKDKKAEETKNDPVILDDPKPANNRQATRREDGNSANNNSGSNEVSTATLMDQIDLSSNAPDNWMMGVRNLKITLRNRSNVTIQTASVTVNYYDENDRLLEKKLIYFNNIAPKGKATVAAPDQKWADHVDFKVTSASAKDDRFASN